MEKGIAINCLNTQLKVIIMITNRTEIIMYFYLSLLIE